MGQEADCTVRYRRRTLAGKAYLETDYVLFRGEERLKILLKDLKGAKAAGGVLRLEFEGGPAEFDLGAAAEKWARKILHPPSRLDKLGIKPGVSVKLVGEFEEDFRAEVRHASTRGSKPDLIFFAAASKADLENVAGLSAAMRADGALWVVYPKAAAVIREIDVLEAGRAAGLKDVEVASFSATHTGLKFVVPLDKRKGL